MLIKTINPATELVIQNYQLLNEKQLSASLEASDMAYQRWRRYPWVEKQQLLLNLSHILKQTKDDWAVLIANEMGKPITAAKQEITKCAWVCDYYAEQGEAYLRPDIVKTELTESFVCYQPLGAILAIMPWNYPFWQVFRSTIPALMAGNTIILKHAPIVTGTGNLIAELFQQAGFPLGSFQHLVIDNQQISRIIANPVIKGVTFTGSPQTGSLIAKLAGENLKKTVLELGGNDPYLVMEDADLDLASTAIVDARLNNCGQVCISPKRIIVIKSQADLLINKISIKMQNYKMGNPLLAKTNLGPIARKDLRELLHRQVQNTIAQGGELVQGGKIPERTGFYYPPTLLVNITHNMTGFAEELFGPVICIINAESEEEAIKLANLSTYGLGAGIFSQNIERARQIAVNEIETGSCFINTTVRSDPRLPFGGIKTSGYGRELGAFGIHEFMNIKTIAIK